MDETGNDYVLYPFRVKKPVATKELDIYLLVFPISFELQFNLSVTYMYNSYSCGIFPIDPPSIIFFISTFFM